jgi:hypothetical protein
VKLKGFENECFREKAAGNGHSTYAGDQLQRTQWGMQRGGSGTGWQRWGLEIGGLGWITTFLESGIWRLMDLV